MFIDHLIYLFFFAAVSGFPRDILDALLPLAADQGFVPDFSVASDEVAQVRLRTLLSFLSRDEATL